MLQTLLIILTLFSSSKSQDCLPTFFQTEAVVTFLRGQQRIILTKCATADLKNAVEIDIKDQDVPNIAWHAFSNISTLESVRLEDTRSWRIERGSFFNLPNLKTIVIKHNQLGIIDERVFEDLPIHRLELTDNNLYNIYRNAFQNSEELRIIKLNKNRLTHFFPDWFQSSRQSIQHLDLSENLLEYIPRSSFANYTNLATLLLDHNRIKSLHPDVFKGLGRIQLLDLSHNYLKEIYRYLTDPFSQSKIELKLNNNQLNYLVESFVYSLQFGKVYLYSNPWKCACYGKILEWARKHQANFILKGDCANDEYYPVCVEQERFPKKCIQEVDDNVTMTYYYNYRKVPCHY